MSYWLRKKTAVISESSLVSWWALHEAILECGIMSWRGTAPERLPKSNQKLETQVSVIHNPYSWARCFAKESLGKLRSFKNRLWSQSRCFTPGIFVLCAMWRLKYNYYTHWPWRQKPESQFTPCARSWCSHWCCMFNLLKSFAPLHLLLNQVEYSQCIQMINTPWVYCNSWFDFKHSSQIQSRFHLYGYY